MALSSANKTEILDHYARSLATLTAAHVVEGDLTMKGRDDVRRRIHSVLDLEPLLDEHQMLAAVIESMTLRSFEGQKTKALFPHVAPDLRSAPLKLVTRLYDGPASSPVSFGDTRSFEMRSDKDDFDGLARLLAEQAEGSKLGFVVMQALSQGEASSMGGAPDARDFLLWRVPGLNPDLGIGNKNRYVPLASRVDQAQTLAHLKGQGLSPTLEATLNGEPIPVLKPRPFGDRRPAEVHFAGDVRHVPTVYVPFPQRYF